MHAVKPSLCIAVLAWVACGGDDNATITPQTGPLPQTLFVASEGFVTSYDVATGNERAGTIPNVAGPVDMQALPDGTLLVNLTGRNEVLIFDGRTMLERARLKSSLGTAVRPVHSYLSPTIDGRRLWLSLNDGTGDQAATNSGLLVDVTPGSAGYLKAVGEIPLGVGHHKAAFSPTAPRVVISNLTDCGDVLGVYDYADVANVRRLATLTAAAAGWDGASFARTCDPTYKNGVPPAPHGCATSKVSGKVYCNLTGSGDIVVVDVAQAERNDAGVFRRLSTGGAGGGYTMASRDGNFIFSLQSSPREGDRNRPGEACQVGQLVVIDARTDVVAAELKLLYRGPGCTDMLKGTAAETNEPGHLRLSPDGRTLFVAVGGGFMVADARSDQQVVVDVSDPSRPVQRPSLTIARGSGHRADALSGDGAFLFVTNNEDASVTQIDVATSAVVKTIRTKTRPLTVATWGTTEGPSEPTGPIP